MEKHGALETKEVELHTLGIKSMGRASYQQHENISNCEVIITWISAS